MLKYAGQLAVVTGGTRGIGLAVANVLAAAGASVAVVGRSREAAQAAAASLPVVDNGEGQAHHAIECDVGDPDAIAASFALLPQDAAILVNSAGVARDMLLLRTPPASIKEQIDVNLVGPMLVSRAVIKGMLRNRQGVIVNVGSVVARSGSSGQTAYGAAKAGLEGFTRSLARELGPKGIRTNLVIPGFISTDMTRNITQERQAEILRSTPLGTMGTPDDVAHAIQFLIDNPFVNGARVVIDGGLTA